MRSQSHRGECYDNALPGTTQAENLRPRLKTGVLERCERPVFANLAEAQASIADYFDYYNHDRLHSSIGHQTPYYTHQQSLQTNAPNCPALLDHLNFPATWELQRMGKKITGLLFTIPKVQQHLAAPTVATAATVAPVVRPDKFTTWLAGQSVKL